MPDAIPIQGGGLVGADVKAPVDGHGIAGENLSAEPLRGFEGEGALS
jgi:hypothetical protein